MNKRTKQYLLIGGSILVVAGVIYYFIKKGRSATDEVLDETLQGAVDSTTQGTGNVKPNGGKTPPSGIPTPKAPKELDTPQKVQGFQAWMDAQGRPWINVNGKWHFLNAGEPNVGGKGTGNFGPATAQVWKVFGQKYLAEKAKWSGR